MRDIKFRAWDEGNKIMHYDFEFIRSGGENNDWIVFKSDKQKLDDKIAATSPLDNPYFQQQLKIMQYTGLKDKNSKEIYEGDFCSHENKVRLVSVQAGCWFLGRVDVLGYIKTALLEIIGNIYENSELLEED